jgi:hypothetical protein
VIRLLAVLLVAGLLLSACGTESMATAMRSWTVQGSYNYGSTNKTVIRDARHSATALRTKDETNDELHLLCGVLDYDTEEADGFLPTPDNVATKLLDKAYGNLGAGATICYGASTSASKRARALAYLTKGVGQLDEANARIKSDEATS